MPQIQTGDGTEIYYKDWGKGPVITFSHGWPLCADAWDPQVAREQRALANIKSSSAEAHNQPTGQMNVEIHPKKRILTGLVVDFQ